jgi:hypothetical protein
MLSRTASFAIRLCEEFKYMVGGITGASILVLMPAAIAAEDSELIILCYFHFSGLLLYLILFSVKKGRSSSLKISAFLM